jgi:hypothetical protein
MPDPPGRPTHGVISTNGAAVVSVDHGATFHLVVSETR